MELLAEKTHEKYNYIFPFFIILISTILLSMTKIAGISLCFLVPILLIAFMSGYLNVIAYFLGISFMVYLRLEILNAFMLSILLFGILHTLMYFKRITTNMIVMIATMLVTIYLIYFQYNIYVTIMISCLTFLHSLIFQELIPILMHHNSEVYTSNRWTIIMMIVFLGILPIKQLDVMYFMILLRFLSLLYLYYQGIESLMPCLLYLSMILMIQDFGMKDDVLSLLLPFSIFFIYHPKNKMRCIAIYLLTHIALPLFLNYQYQYHGIIIVMSALLFFLVPRLNIKPALPIISQENDSSLRVVQRANAFASLFQQLTSVFETASDTLHVGEYIGYVYEDVCSNCSSCHYCYHDDGVKRLVRLIDKGISMGLHSDDFSYIHNHCINPNEYLQAIDKYKESYQRIKKYDQQNQNLRKDLYQEFSIISDVFQNFSNSVEHILYDEDRIKEHLRGYQFNVIFLHKHMISNEEYNIELGLRNITKKEITNELLPILENYLNEKLEVTSIKDAMHYLGYTSVVLKHCLNFTIQYGFQQHSYDPVFCGDYYKVFHNHLDYFLAISDGMGQGKKAASESKLTLEVLSKLILNGISLKDTLESVNSLLRIKNHNDMFTTLDLCNINLSSAKMRLMKYGASPSYHIRDNRIVKIESKTLPVGIISMIQLNHYEMSLNEDDILIMTSDGVGDGFEYLLNRHISSISELHPQAISTFLMDQLLQYQRKDDISILVIKLVKQDA